MAINSILAKKIFDDCRGVRGDFLMLGRQNWDLCHGNEHRERWLKELIAEIEKTPAYFYKYSNRPLSEADFFIEDRKQNFSDPFFDLMGFCSVSSLDASDFENPTIVHNIGAPIPDELANSFDVIYDGGTLEHVFNYPQASLNVHRMLRPGGIFIAHTPANNFYQHGFYQIGPEVFYSFWVKTLNYNMLTRPYFMPLRSAFSDRSVQTTNPLETGKRPRLLGNLMNKQTILVTALQKRESSNGNTEEIVELPEVYQSDYYARWTDKNKS